MPMVMENTDWLQAVSGASRADRVWFEIAKPKANRISFDVPRAFGSYSFQIVMIPVAENAAKAATSESSSALMKKLRLIPKKYATPDWDGYGAKPVNLKCHKSAMVFARKLPSELMDAEVGVTADGDVDFEWYRGKSKRCIFVFSSEGKVHCVASGGKSKLSATFVSPEPQDLIDIVRRFVRG